MDVARKALILGRLLGFEGELADVTVESLVAPDAAHMPLAKFVAQLERWDDAWSARVARATARGGVLRYQVSASARKVSVGLVVADSCEPDGVAARHGQPVRVRERSLQDESDGHFGTRRGP